MGMKERDAFTGRVLMSLVTTLADTKRHVADLEAQIVALAKEHGVAIPTDD
jgi:hypothetical protein